MRWVTSELLIRRLVKSCADKYIALARFTIATAPAALLLTLRLAFLAVLLRGIHATQTLRTSCADCRLLAKRAFGSHGTFAQVACEQSEHINFQPLLDWERLYVDLSVALVISLRGVQARSYSLP